MESMFIRWAKAFIVYFCIVVTLQSLIEFMYAHSLLQMPMMIMGTSIPSAYVYGFVLGLVLSVSHFVLGKTIQKGREHIIREHLAANPHLVSPPSAPAESRTGVARKKTAKRKRK